MTLLDIKHEFDVTFDAVLLQIDVIDMISKKITDTYSLKEKKLSNIISQLKYEQRLLIELNNHCKRLDEMLHESFTILEASKL